MSKNTGNAPAWLFSFLDLAFLILIALVHFNSGPRDAATELGEIELSEIERSELASPVEHAGTLLHVRVHPREAHDRGDAFSLVSEASPGGQGGTSMTDRLSERELRKELGRLSLELESKPILAPHRDSRAEDFLTALAIVQHLWPATSSAAVRPTAALPSVAAPVPAS